MGKRELKRVQNENKEQRQGWLEDMRKRKLERFKNKNEENIITREKSGKEVHVSRVTLDSSKGQLACNVQRRHFSPWAAFAMTMHESQGKSFEFVGVTTG